MKGKVGSKNIYLPRESGGGVSLFIFHHIQYRRQRRTAYKITLLLHFLNLPSQKLHLNYRHMYHPLNLKNDLSSI
jgi:hypothetical protein